ncbi:hypothetical protein GCM10027589_13820 [Actinocorallia lasiicapitis]
MQVFWKVSAAVARRVLAVRPSGPEGVGEVTALVRRSRASAISVAADLTAGSSADAAAVRIRVAVLV